MRRSEQGSPPESSCSRSIEVGRQVGVELRSPDGTPGQPRELDLGDAQRDGRALGSSTQLE